MMPRLPAVNIKHTSDFFLSTKVGISSPNLQSLCLHKHVLNSHTHTGKCTDVYFMYHVKHQIIVLKQWVQCKCWRTALLVVPLLFRLQLYIQSHVACFACLTQSTAGFVLYSVTELQLCLTEAASCDRLKSEKRCCQTLTPIPSDNDWISFRSPFSLKGLIMQIIKCAFTFGQFKILNFWC